MRYRGVTVFVGAITDYNGVVYYILRGLDENFRCNFVTFSTNSKSYNSGPRVGNLHSGVKFRLGLLARRWEVNVTVAS